MVTVGTDTYVTLSEASAYLGRRLRTGAWDAAAPTVKETALTHACLLLEALPWAGHRWDRAQTLAFPRIFHHEGHHARWHHYPLAGPVLVPQAVKDAQCELALALLTFDSEALTALAAAGVTRQTIGSSQTDLARTGGQFHALPPIVQSLLGEFVLLGAELSR